MGSLTKSLNNGRHDLQLMVEAEHEELEEGLLGGRKCCRYMDEETDLFCKTELDDSEMLTEFPFPMLLEKPKSQAPARLNIARISRMRRTPPTARQCWVDATCKNFVVIGTRSIRNCLHESGRLHGSEILLEDCDDQEESATIFVGSSVLVE
jgi:hypothetical protein